MLTEQDKISRFFTYDDEKQAHFVFDLPDTWWSRFYEYPWASKFVDKDDVVLDAASGICHPFKFYLAENCKEIHACDLDNRIESIDKIREDIRLSISPKANSVVSDNTLNKIKYKKGDLSSLSYQNGYFSKIFCISVLEHVDAETQLKILKEFKRILREDGAIILTVDYTSGATNPLPQPNLDINALIESINLVGLEFVADINFNIPINAIETDYFGTNLKCVRMLLKKKSE